MWGVQIELLETYRSTLALHGVRSGIRTHAPIRGPEALQVPDVTEYHADPITGRGNVPGPNHRTGQPARTQSQDGATCDSYSAS